MLKSLIIALMLTSLIIQVPVYEYRVDLSVSQYTIVCDVILTSRGRIAESACYLPQALGISYVNPRSLKVPGTDITLAEVIVAALHPGARAGDVKVRVGYYLFDVRYKLLSTGEVNMVTREGLVILSIICLAVVGGAAYTILRRYRYSAW